MQEEEAPVFFDAVLTPHRSLDPIGFRILMAAVAGVSVAAGTAFLLIGAWPVVGFLGLDVLLLYLAFRLSYRSGRLAETVQLGRQALLVRRRLPDGRILRWRFEPTWLKVDMDDPPRHHSQLVLSSHGRRLAIGAFLAPFERHDLARALGEALARRRAALGASEVT